MKLNIHNYFINHFEADPETLNFVRKVQGSLYSWVPPVPSPKAKLIHFSQDMCDELGITPEDIQSTDFIEVFSGTKLYPNTQPYAMNYGGHQFGQWAGQLGDGRAINLMEVQGKTQNWTVQLKGAGPTPYSRMGDGFAVLRSSIREHLCSEAMFFLGIPTTRSLCLITTDKWITRDMFYNGNPIEEPGAIVCRVAHSFIRFGNFQLLAAQGEIQLLTQLADYTIAQFYPQYKDYQQEKYVLFFKEVAQKTLELVWEWQRVGFVHGVMNTDNFSILGQTLDYGPYGWLEGFDENWTPNITDSQGRRYRFGNQPTIAFWNLVQLANALVPITQNPQPYQEVLDELYEKMDDMKMAMYRKKLGLEKQSEEDTILIDQLEKNLQLMETDYTIFFRELSSIPTQQSWTPSSVTQLMDKSWYHSHNHTPFVVEQWIQWFQKYQLRVQQENPSDLDRKKKMDAVNPKYVLRNYMSQLAIEAAEKGNYKLIEELYTLLQKPYAEQIEHEKWYAKRPEWARDKPGSSMLSCSS